jgi:hypothetical protein
VLYHLANHAIDVRFASHIRADGEGVDPVRLQLGHSLGGGLGGSVIVQSDAKPAFGQVLGDYVAHATPAATGDKCDLASQVMLPPYWWRAGER